MAQTIKIKRSTGSAAPSTLAQGELAYSKGSDTLYVGDPATANTPIAVGGAIKNNAGSPVLATGVTAAEIRTLVGVDASGTDNSTNVTLAGTPDYITISGQTITRNLVNLTTDVTGDLPVAEGGTGASTAAAARTNLGVDAAGTDNSTAVTLAGTPDYITITGQTITRNAINLGTDVTGSLPNASVTGLGSLALLSAVGAAQITDNTVGAAELNVTGNGTSGQALLSDGDGTFSWGASGFDANVDNPAVGNGSAVGTNSSAYGHDATASGTSSIAVGYGANVGSATTSSIAIGTDTDATADSAVALGVLAQATGIYAVAIGQQAAAAGQGGVSIGYATSTASGGKGVAIGFNADAQASGVAIGDNVNTTSSRGIAIGHDTDANGSQSVAIGDNANTAASATYGVAIGDNANANAANTLHINASGVTTNAPATAGHMVIETDDAKIEYDGNWDVSGGTVTVEAMTVTGDLTVSGTTTTVNSTTVTVDDPVFTVGGDTAPASDDNKDRGIEFRYHNGTVAKSGFFGFDDSSGKFTFIPDATNTSEVFSGSTGTITADLEGNADTATALATSRNFSITGDITASSVGFDGSGNVALSANIDAGVVGSTELASSAVTNAKISNGAVSFAKLSTAAVTTSAETFSDSDTQLMTAAAIDDLIVGKGYSTGAGDITSVQISSTDGSVSGTGTGTTGAISFDLEVATIDGGTY